MVVLSVFFSSFMVVLSIFANVPLHHRPSTVFCPAPNAIKLCSTTKHVVMNVVVVSSLYYQLHCKSVFSVCKSRINKLLCNMSS